MGLAKKLAIASLIGISTVLLNSESRAVERDENNYAAKSEMTYLDFFFYAGSAALLAAGGTALEYRKRKEDLKIQ